MMLHHSLSRSTYTLSVLFTPGRLKSMMLIKDIQTCFIVADFGAARQWKHQSQRHYHGICYHSFSLGKNPWMIHKCSYSVNKTDGKKRVNDTGITDQKAKDKEALMMERVLKIRRTDEINHFIFEKNKNYHRWILAVEPPWLLESVKHENFKETEGFSLPALSEFDSVIFTEPFSFKDAMTLLQRMSTVPPLEMLSMCRTDVFHELLDRIASQFISLTDEELFTLFRHLAVLPFRRAINDDGRLVHEDFCKRLSNHCKKRIKNWERDTRLLAANIFYWLSAYLPYHYDNKSYIYKTIGGYRRNLEKVDRYEMVVLFFYMSVLRWWPHDLLVHLESKPLEFWSDLTLAETGVICLGFFLVQHSIQSEELLLRMVDCLHQNINTMDGANLTAVCKIVSQSLRANTNNHGNNQVRHSLCRFFRNGNLPLRVVDLGALNMWRLLKLAATAREISAPVLEAVASAVKTSDLHTWRLKDIAWTTFMLAQFQYAVNDSSLRATVYGELCNALGNKTKFRRMMKKYPDNLRFCLMGLINMQIFPHQFISEALDHSYLNRKKGYEYEIEEDANFPLLLLETVNLEVPDYHGNKPKHLNQSPGVQSATIKWDRKIFKQQTSSSGDWNREEFTKAVDQVLTEDILCQIGCTKLHPLLPYSKTCDFEIRFDKNKHPIPVELWENLEMKEPSVESCTHRLAVMVNAPYCYYDFCDGEKTNLQLFGYHATRKRHLQKKGFQIVEINSHLYRDLYKKTSEHHGHSQLALKEALSESVKQAMQC